MPSILMNVYVVGLNQLFDVDIDKVIENFKCDQHFDMIKWASHVSNVLLACKLLLYVFR